MPDEVVVPYDWKKSLVKALWAVGHALSAVVASAFFTWLGTDPEVLHKLIAALPPAWVPIAGLLASAAVAYGRNWYKHA